MRIAFNLRNCGALLLTINVLRYLWRYHLHSMCFILHFISTKIYYYYYYILGLEFHHQNIIPNHRIHYLHVVYGIITFTKFSIALILWYYKYIHYMNILSLNYKVVEACLISPSIALWRWVSNICRAGRLLSYSSFGQRGSHQL